MSSRIAGLCLAVLTGACAQGAGPAGPAGLAGTKGETGVTGGNGVAGGSGSNGSTGGVGATGATGTPGVTGPTGPTQPITSSDTGSTLVARDLDGGFAAANVRINGNMTVDGNLVFPATASAETEGNIVVGGQPEFSAAPSLNNLWVGQGASAPATTGTDNVAMGAQALASVADGASNTAIGSQAAGVLSGGSNNTAVGAEALQNVSGSGNIAVGYQAGSLLTTNGNNIDIGHLGATAEADTIRIGTTQTATYIAGISTKPSAGGIPVLINSSGLLGTSSSSAKFKQDIHDMGDESRVLMELRPVSFRYRKEYDPDGLQQFGLIAEEVEKKAPDLVAYDKDGKPYTVRYNLVNAMLLNEVQRQQKQIDQLMTRLNALEAKGRRSGSK